MLGCKTRPTNQPIVDDRLHEPPGESVCMYVHNERYLVDPACLHVAHPYVFLNNHTQHIYAN